MRTGAIIILDFIIAFFVVGFVLWIFTGILPSFRALSETGTNYDLAMMFWYGFPVLFCVLAIFWVYSKMKEWRMIRRL